MYRKIAVTERLPEDGKEVITIDSEGNAISYKRFGDSWNMVNANNNKPIEFWLEEVEDGTFSETFKTFIDRADKERYNIILICAPESGKGTKLHFQGNAYLIEQMVTQIMRYSNDIAEVFIDAVDAYKEQNKQQS